MGRPHFTSSEVHPSSSQEHFLDILPDPALTQFHAVPSGPVAFVREQSIELSLPMRSYSLWEASPQPALLRAEQTLGPQLLRLLLPLYTICCPSLDTNSFMHCLFLFLFFPPPRTVHSSQGEAVPVRRGAGESLPSTVWQFCAWCIPGYD